MAEINFAAFDGKSVPLHFEWEAEQSNVQHEDNAYSRKRDCHKTSIQKWHHDNLRAPLQDRYRFEAEG